MASVGRTWGSFRARPRLMDSASIAASCSSANDLSQHPAVAPEPTARCHAAPDRRSGRNGVDAAEHCLANGLLRPVTALQQLQLDVRIDVVDSTASSCDFGLANVRFQVTL